jgi:hypothetical protein
VAKTKGDIQAIGGLIQQRYGESQKDYEQKLAGIIKRFETNKPSGSERVEDTSKH